MGDKKFAGVDEEDEVVKECQISDGLEGYIFISVVAVFAVTIVGIPLIPFALIFCCMLVPPFRRSIKVSLSQQALNVESGPLWGNCVPRVEKHILLNRIQDVVYSQGCVERFVSQEAREGWKIVIPWFNLPLISYPLCPCN